MFQTLKSRDEKEGSGMGLAIFKKAQEFCGAKVEIDDSSLCGAAMAMIWPIQQPQLTSQGAKDAQRVLPISH